MNLAQKQNQADCIADRSMSCADQSNMSMTDRANGPDEVWAYTERTEKDGEDSKTPMNKSKRSNKKSVTFDQNELPENQEWADI